MCVCVQSLLPATCHLLVEGESGDPSADATSSLAFSASSFVDVATAGVRKGDCVLVLPGETIPVDVSHTPAAQKKVKRQTMYKKKQ